MTLNHFDKTLDMIVGTDWSTGGRSAIVFQVSKDKTKVLVVAHFYRANSRKYERLMPAFLGELETITEASEHFGDMIAMLEAQLIFLSDHKPIIDASKDDFKKLLEDGTKRYPRLIYAAIDKLAALNAIYCSIAGVDNYPPDLKSRTAGEVTKGVLVPRNKMLWGRDPQL